MGLTLTEFIEARLADDETTAKCAQMWQQEHHHAVFIAHYGSEWGAIDDYDPARVLRDVEAKRRILTEHRAVTKLADLTGQELGFLGWYREWILKNLASVWSGHPDYDPAWG